MKVRIFDYSSALDNPYVEDLITTFAYLDSLKSFKSWRNKLKEHFEDQILHLPNVSQSLINYFYELINSESSLGMVAGPCCNLIYHWPGGEPKVLHIWDDRALLTDNRYWLDSFQFLKISTDNVSCTFNERELVEFRKLDDCENTISLTHNNHFGHFTVDNLPLLTLLEGPLASLLPKSKPLHSNYNPRKVIKDLIDKGCPSLEYEVRNDFKESLFDKQSYILRSKMNYQVISSNILCNAYLIDRRSKARAISKTLSIKEGRNYQKKIFLIRANKYNSRVYNISALSDYLKNLGFIIIDPSALNLVELEQILTSSKIVIAESGSTTLNALWFCSNTAKIISLVPDDLIFNTSIPMIHGGLPYVLPFLDRIHIFIGRSQTHHQTQSSNSCIYDCKSLGTLLKSI